MTNWRAKAKRVAAKLGCTIERGDDWTDHGELLLDPPDGKTIEELHQMVFTHDRGCSDEAWRDIFETLTDPNVRIEDCTPENPNCQSGGCFAEGPK